jgi:colicin import membrane protein
MWQAVRENPRAVIYAVLMHVGLLLLLLFSLDWTPKSVKPGTTKPIQAELVDMSKLREIEALKRAEKAAKDKAAKDKAVKEKAVKEKAVKEKAAKDKAAMDKAAKEKAVKEKAAKEKAAQEKAVKEKAAKEKAAQKKAVKEKAAQEKAAKEKAAQKKAVKEKAAQEKAVKEKAAQEKAAQEKAAKEKAAKEKAEAARQREAEMALQAQLAKEAAQARAQSALSEFIPYIQDKVQNNWLRPAGSQPGLSCVIQVTLIPGGDVVGTRVVQSSGNALFDASVERAVQKASPLPLPNDPALFKYFREINFRFVPD